jgi:hypothetical protein
VNLCNMFSTQTWVFLKPTNWSFCDILKWFGYFTFMTDKLPLNYPWLLLHFPIIVNKFSPFQRNGDNDEDFPFPRIFF